MREQDGSGKHDGDRALPGGAFDRIARRLEEALDRASDAVERRMENLERRLADTYEGETGHHGPDAAGNGKAADQDQGAKPDPAPDAGDHPVPPEDDAPGIASRLSKGYSNLVEKARTGVSGVVAKGAGALDDVAGESPWRMAGLDARRTRIAREVMRDVVPKVAGDRVASVMDGAAMKGGVAGVGLLLRIPLKGFAVPFLLGITAVETVRAVREVRESVADVAARVDNEARSEEAYRTGADVA